MAKGGHRHSYDELRRKTAPLVLLERAHATPDAVAFYAKKEGIYRARSWGWLADSVARCAAGLQSLGLAPGERVAIMGDACEEWVIADMAAQATGAVTYGIYPTASVAELRYQMADGEAVLFVAENQEYVDKILPLLDDLPRLRHVVVIDTTALFAYDHPKLVSLDEVMARDETAPAARAEAFERAVRALDPAAPAFIVYTSGTTGDPKGAVVTHGAHLAGAYNLIMHYDELRRPGQRTVVYLPLCHVLGRDAGITWPLLSDVVPFFGESVEDLPTTLFEVAPTLLWTVPRYLQKLASQILVGIENTSRLKRLAYDLALGIGRRHARRRWTGERDPLGQALYGLARVAVFRPILNQLGLDRIELLMCGGAPLAPETMALWQIYGVNVVEFYGQTETAGAIIAGQPSPFPRPGDVGTPPPEWETRLAESGEILVRGADLFAGYLNQPDATEAVMARDGWLRTGDVGEVSDNRLRIVDRARDFIVTAGGKTLSPTAIENALRASPYVSEVVVFGHNRKYVTALVEMDFDTVADWARANDVAYTGFTSLSAHPAVTALLRREIDRANQQLARVEQVKNFRILPKALDPEEEGEPVTPTRKVKRQLMYERFRDLVESMYDTSEDERVARDIGDIVGEARAAGAA